MIRSRKVRTVFAFRVLHGNVIHIRKGRADGHLAHEGYGTILSERRRNRGVADDEPHKGGCNPAASIRSL